MGAYEEMFNATSTPWAPWYIIPAEHKWFTRLAVVSVINYTLDSLKFAYPTISKEQKEALLAAKAELEKEDGGSAKDVQKEKKGNK
jgi:hypothetical protein